MSLRIIYFIFVLIQLGITQFFFIFVEGKGSLQDENLFLKDFTNLPQRMSSQNKKRVILKTPNVTKKKKNLTKGDLNLALIVSKPYSKNIKNNKENDPNKQDNNSISSVSEFNFDPEPENSESSDQVTFNEPSLMNDLKEKFNKRDSKKQKKKITPVPSLILEGVKINDDINNEQSRNDNEDEDENVDEYKDESLKEDDLSHIKNNKDEDQYKIQSIDQNDKENELENKNEYLSENSQREEYMSENEDTQLSEIINDKNKNNDQILIENEDENENQNDENIKNEDYELTDQSEHDKTKKNKNTDSISKRNDSKSISRNGFSSSSFSSFESQLADRIQDNIFDLEKNKENEKEIFDNKKPNIPKRKVIRSIEENEDQIEKKNERNKKIKLKDWLSKNLIEKAKLKSSQKDKSPNSTDKSETQSTFEQSSDLTKNFNKLLKLKEPKLSKSKKKVLFHTESNSESDESSIKSYEKPKVERQKSFTELDKLKKKQYSKDSESENSNNNLDIVIEKGEKIVPLQKNSSVKIPYKKKVKHKPKSILYKNYGTPNDLLIQKNLIYRYDSDQELPEGSFINKLKIKHRNRQKKIRKKKERENNLPCRVVLESELSSDQSCEFRDEEEFEDNLRKNSNSFKSNQSKTESNQEDKIDHKYELEDEQDGSEPILEDNSKFEDSLMESEKDESMESTSRIIPEQEQKSNDSLILDPLLKHNPDLELIPTKSHINSSRSSSRLEDILKSEIKKKIENERDSVITSSESEYSSKNTNLKNSKPIQNSLEAILLNDEFKQLKQARDDYFRNKYFNNEKDNLPSEKNLKDEKDLNYEKHLSQIAEKEALLLELENITKELEKKKVKFEKDRESEDRELNTDFDDYNREKVENKTKTEILKHEKSTETQKNETEILENFPEGSLILDEDAVIMGIEGKDLHTGTVVLDPENINDISFEQIEDEGLLPINEYYEEEGLKPIVSKIDSENEGLAPIEEKNVKIEELRAFEDTDRSFLPPPDENQLSFEEIYLTKHPELLNTDAIQTIKKDKAIKKAFNEKSKSKSKLKRKRDFEDFHLSDVAIQRLKMNPFKTPEEKEKIFRILKAKQDIKRLREGEFKDYSTSLEASELLPVENNNIEFEDQLNKISDNSLLDGDFERASEFSELDTEASKSNSSINNQSENSESENSEFAVEIGLQKLNAIKLSEAKHKREKVRPGQIPINPPDYKPQKNLRGENIYLNNRNTHKQKSYQQKSRRK